MIKNFDLGIYLDSRRTVIEKRLMELMENKKSSIRINDAMKYSLMAGGKRLRPVLCLAAEEVIEKSSMASIDCACAIEMIHTYSLIHDDLPAMDNDDMRRGKETCHKKFDEATAILAGDALLTKAFEVLSSQNIPSNKIVDTIKAISLASGDKGMVSGQMKDILSETKKISIEELQDLHMEKTGALIRASLKSGAIIGEASKKELTNLDLYGKNIGLAFQVTDDILNVTGDPLMMGKAAGSDAELEKATYPSIMGLDNSIKFAEKLIEEAMDYLSIFGEKKAPLMAIAKYILTRKR